MVKVSLPKLEEGNVISFLLVLLCILASLDIWRQYAVKNDTFWQQHYNQAVRSSYDFWRMGFRLEDLELKLDKQRKHLEQYMHKIDVTLAPRLALTGNMLRRNTRYVEYVRDSRISLYNLQHNDTRVYSLTCEEGGPAIRFGLNDFRTDPRDECQLFTNVKSHQTLGPQNFFHVVPLAEGAIALRSVASSMFVKVVPPPNDNKNAPWKVVIGGPVVGAAETFRISDEGYLYSPLLNGFFTCGGGQPVLGYSGKYGSWNHFFLQALSEEKMREAYLLVDLSRKLQRIQNNYYDKRFQVRADGSMVARSTVPSSSSSNNKIIKGESGNSTVTQPIKICMAIPITSKGTDMKLVVDSPFWNNLFDSFMKSIDWRSNHYIFRFFLGFDRGDPLYDTGDAWSDLREEFKHRAIYRMSEQMMDEAAINAVLETQLSVKLMHFDHLQGAPSQVVSQLVLAAYEEGFDYFYQVNDDSVLDSPNWAPALINALRSNPVYPNLGATGPRDANNDKIFTHSFVHRTHIDIFGHLFPPSFKNWWSDDWISTVYGRLHTFRCNDVVLQHNVKGQKTGDLNRYEVDRGAQFELENELRLGHAQIDRWLRSQNAARLPLPEICGYLPAVRYLSETMMDKHAAIESV